MVTPPAAFDVTFAFITTLPLDGVVVANETLPAVMACPTVMVPAACRLNAAPVLEVFTATTPEASRNAPRVELVLAATVAALKRMAVVDV